MTIVCTSDEILDGAVPKEKLLFEEVVVTDLDRRFHVGYDKDEIQRIWAASREAFSLPPATLHEETDRYRSVGSHEELVEKLHIFRDGLNDRALELVKSVLVCENLQKELDDAEDENDHGMHPYFYDHRKGREPIFIRQSFPQLFEFGDVIRQWHDFNLELLKTKPLPRHLTLSAVPVDLAWALWCDPYVEEDVSKFLERKGVRFS